MAGGTWPCLDCTSRSQIAIANATPMPNPSPIPIRALLEMPAFLEAVYPTLPDPLLRAPSTRDKMPLLEQLWHVRDCESDLYAPRIRRTLAEDRPFLEPMEVGHWPEERG